MFDRFSRSRTVLAAVFLAAGAARADQLVLHNGDHLTGKVIRRENGKIYFHSDLLGDLVAPDNLATVADNPPSSTPSESLVGLPPQPVVKTLQPPPPGVSATHPPAGPPAPPAPPPPPPAPPPAGRKAAPAVAAEPPAVVPARGGRAQTWLARPLQILAVLKPWSGKLEFGYDNEFTNVRTININLRGEADRTSGPNDFMAQGKYLYGFSAGQTNTDQEEYDFRWRHHLNERFFTQSLSSYGTDKVRQLREDIDQNAGIGYKLFQGVRQTVDVGVGLIGQYLDVAGTEKGYDYLGNVFQDYTYKINGRYTFMEDASADYAPERKPRFGLVNGQVVQVGGSTLNYDYKFHATLQGKISEHLSLNLHFEYQYYNAIADPHARADQHVTTTLGYSF